MSVINIITIYQGAGGSVSANSTPVVPESHPATPAPPVAVRSFNLHDFLVVLSDIWCRCPLPPLPLPLPPHKEPPTSPASSASLDLFEYMFCPSFLSLRFSLAFPARRRRPSRANPPRDGGVDDPLVPSHVLCTY
jgi:hypothetical protein